MVTENPKKTNKKFYINLMALDLDEDKEISFPEKVPVLNNFDVRRPMGFAKLSFSDGMLTAEIDFDLHLPDFIVKDKFKAAGNIKVGNRGKIELFEIVSLGFSIT